MKRNILFINLMIAITIYAQDDRHIYADISSGTGATIEYVKSTVGYTNVKSPGSIIGYAKVSNSVYGYQIPVNFHILYGASRWRIGLNVSYEYINMLRLKTIEKYPDGQPNSVSSQSQDYSFHLIKTGASFEYDFWAKKKCTVGLSSDFGYYFIAKYSYGTFLFKPPFLYGGVGVQSSYLLPQGFQILYGLSLDVQGYLEPQLGHPVFFEPRITIGIRKGFSLKSKSKKT